MTITTSVLCKPIVSGVTVCSQKGGSKREVGIHGYVKFEGLTGNVRT